MRILIPITALSVTLSPLFGQEEADSDAVCWHARPGNECVVTVLTTAGMYLKPIPGNEVLARGVVDWGFLFRISPNDAAGASVLLSGDNDDFVVGFELRYRRWIGSEQSVDLAAGLPVTGEPVSLYGLIKWNPVHWFGLAVRPEWRKKPVENVYVLDLTGAVVQKTDEASHFHLSMGLEFGWWPGLALSVAGGVVLLLIAIALSGMH